MMTELMGLLIFCGALLVGFAKYQTRQHTTKLTEQDMKVSTEKLQKELEKSGDEIIRRMGEQVERLEHLIREADRRAEVLDAKLTELHTLEQQMDVSTEEADRVKHELHLASQTGEEFLREMQTTGAAMPNPLPAGEGARERVDAEDFNRVLHQSMLRDEARQAEGNRPVYVLSAQASAQAEKMAQDLHMLPQEKSGLPETAAEKPGQEETEQVSEAARVRGLLLAGWSPEEVSKETGMGRGAIELMQEMMRRQISRADA